MAPKFYESEKLLNEYLLFHYGTRREILPYSGGPFEALNFPCRIVGETLMDVSHARRALDLGCSVGRSSFELSKFCDEVVGIDFSESFIRAAEAIRTKGELAYQRLEEGSITTPMVARRPEDARSDRIHFEVGNAVSLRDDLGSFDLLLAANLLCRLPDPAAFLDHLPVLVEPGGHMVFTTPCTWLEEFTPRDKWPDRPTIDWMTDRLGDEFELHDTRDVPFLIRETARKFQWTVALATLWKRRA